MFPWFEQPKIEPFVLFGSVIFICPAPRSRGQGSIPG